MLTCLVLLALLASIQGRAVNISNTWVLPEEGFPVFYRYFRDRISWYEADAVCQFHHANLVTVDTTAQYDAVRAYLKELDISSAVWVGLIRSNPDGDFTWTDYRGLSGDGYWSSAPDARAAPLCAAADPAADYRWEARACGGPTVASFICELPVPQWALGNEGCMVRELPALTILYLPESAAVQLTADCGFAGVKRVQCTGNVKRESLLKNLSCEEDEISSTSSPMLAGSTWSLPDLTANSTDFETTDITTEEDLTTVHETKATQTTQTTPTPTSMPEKVSLKLKPVVNKFNTIYIQKNVNLDLNHNNNLQSNDIPKLANNENFLTLEQSEKLEDQKHLHHKMLHDELAKHANFETVFTQPTDHFVPPLVMAKSKISDDMTVLSLAEKHAQQLAEQGYGKHSLLEERKSRINFEINKESPKVTTEVSSKIEVMNKPIVFSLQPVNTKDSVKKDKIKSLPKKYIEKYEDPKGRNLKIDGKLLKFDKTTEKNMTVSDVSTTKITDLTESSKVYIDDTMELTVKLKEPGDTIIKVSTPKLATDNFNIQNDESKINYIVTTEGIMTESPLKITRNIMLDHDITKQMNIEDDKTTDTTHINSQVKILNTESATTVATTQTDLENKQNISMNHEIIKITIINEDKTNPTETVYEITTLVPDFKDVLNSDTKSKYSTSHSFGTANNISSTEASSVASSAYIGTTQEATVTPSATESNAISTTSKTKTEAQNVKINEPTTSEIPATTKADNVTETMHVNHVTENENNTTPTTNFPYTTTKEKVEAYNLTEIYEDEGRNATDREALDDLNSPLLSAANEPLHRPNRSRRPQTPPRLNKFNPFRILG